MKMKRAILSVFVCLLLIGGIYSTEAKAEREWYKVKGGSIFVYDDFRIKYPWIDWIKWANDSGLPFGGFIPGIAHNPNPNDGTLKGDFVNEAQMRGIDINIEEVNLSLIHI